MTAADRILFRHQSVRAESRPAEFFQVIRSLLHLGPSVVDVEPLEVVCNQITTHFADKINHIPSDLELQFRFTELRCVKAPSYFMGLFLDYGV